MFLTTVSLIIVITTASGSQSSNSEDIDIYNEIACLSVGGICIPAAECPEGKGTQLRGLCPLQEGSGIECCHSLPRSEKRCHHRGGICMAEDSTCPDRLTFKEARDCEYNEKCCILVH